MLRRKICTEVPKTPKCKQYREPTGKSNVGPVVKEAKEGGNLTLRVKMEFSIIRGSYMSAHVVLNLLNELRKRDKMRGLPSILSLFRNGFNRFNSTGVQMLDSIFHKT